MMYAGKQVCRGMSAPSTLGWKALKRIGRYLQGKPRLVYVYRRQELDAIDVDVDTDWAGCAKTRKSTSGGAIMLVTIGSSIGPAHSRVSPSAMGKRSSTE